MTRSLLTRLKRLEEVRSVEQGNRPMMIELGYVVKRLPPEYSGTRHLATLGPLPDGKHQWEERPGPAPPRSGAGIASSLNLSRPSAIQRT